MNAMTATGKGAATRDAIVDRAYEIARCSGVEGLSIGPLADAVGMSKSGVFAHFGSREELQLAVLDAAGTRFGNAVLMSALAQPRGWPRLQTIMRNWFEWVRTTAGGCVLLAAVSEYDDRPGPLHDRIRDNEQRWRAHLYRALQQAIDAGHLRDEDVDQSVFDLYAIALGVHHEAGLFGYDTARSHGEAALERFYVAHAP